jgi:hypothetical protein
MLGYRSSAHLAPLLFGLVSASACSDSPSFALRWSIADAGSDPTNAPMLNNASLCTAAGLSELEIAVLHNSGANQGAQALRYRTRCFEPSFTDSAGRHEGPELEPGDYVLALSGLRRNGLPWDYSTRPTDPAPSPYFATYAANNGRAAYATATFTVKEDKTTDLGTLALVAPPACDDGIDNDRDGQVDRRDAQCQLSEILGATASEGTSDREIVFSYELTSFGERPGPLLWDTLGLPQVALRIGNQPLAASACENPERPVERLDASSIDFSQCVRVQGNSALTLAAEVSCIVVDSVDASRLGIAAREPGCYPIDVTWGTFDANAGGFVPHSRTLQIARAHPQHSSSNILPFDLHYDDVDADIRATWSQPISLLQQLIPQRPAVQSCAPQSVRPSLNLGVSSYLFRLTDHLGEVRPDLLAQWSFDGVVPGEGAAIDAEGFLEVPCLTKSILPTGLNWDGPYTIEVRARGVQVPNNEVEEVEQIDVCLATPAAVVMNPGSVVSLKLEPLRPDDAALPANCVQCNDDSQCTADPTSDTPQLRCDAGRCRP